MYSSKLTIAGTLLIVVISGFEGVKIIEFELPVAVHNGTGPVELKCIYEVDEEENGLVVKWYHDTDQIYQWIPPMAPMDIGVISGLTEYPAENTNRPLSHSIIRLKRVTLDMTGDYTCSVSTFQEDVAEEKRMTVYVPDHDLRIYSSFYNATHMNLTCLARGARPSPSLTIIVNDQQLDDKNIRVENYRDIPWIRDEVIVPDFPDITIIQCEIYIPGTGYRKRDRFIYYPRNFLHGNEANEYSTFHRSTVVSLVLSTLTFFMS